MSNNADFDALARELRALRDDDSDESRNRQAMLVVRLVRGLSPERWQSFCAAFPSSRWGALPLTCPHEAELADLRADAQGPVPPEFSPDALNAALNAALFNAQLCREILRLKRADGSLSLLCAAMAQRRRIAVALGEGTAARLETQLAEILRDNLEQCDSLGLAGKGRYAAIFPGMGRHKARRLASKIQQDFEAQAKDFFPTGGISAGAGAHCAVGVVCMDHNDGLSAPALLDKSLQALDTALHMESGFVHLDCPRRQDEKAALVHSNEKRFLFGGK